MAKDGVPVMSKNSGNWLGRVQRQGPQPRSSDGQWLPLHRKPVLKGSRSNGSDSVKEKSREVTRPNGIARLEEIAVRVVSCQGRFAELSNKKFSVPMLN